MRKPSRWKASHLVLGHFCPECSCPSLNVLLIFWAFILLWESRRLSYLLPSCLLRLYVLLFIRDGDLGVAVKERVKVWNPVVADITLLAFGTSAPPIFLSILSAVRQLGNPEGDSSKLLGIIQAKVLRASGSNQGRKKNGDQVQD